MLNEREAKKKFKKYFITLCDPKKQAQLICADGCVKGGNTWRIGA